MNYCAYCGKPLDTSSELCPKCRKGANFAKWATEHNVYENIKGATLNKAPNSILCNSCSKEYIVTPINSLAQNHKVSFCPYCGAGVRTQVDSGYYGFIKQEHKI